MKPLLKISNLSIHFQVRNSEFSAVKNLNLEIAENQIVGLVGNLDQANQSLQCLLCDYFQNPRHLMEMSHQSYLTEQKS